MFAIHDQLVRDHVEELIRDAHRGAEAARALKAARASKAARAARSSVPECAVPNPA